VVLSGLKESTYPLAFPPQKADAELKLSLGDVRKTVSVLPRTRPELTTLSIRTKLPKYLQYKTEPVTEVHGGAVSVLKGAEAALEATASRELASAEVDGAKAEGFRREDRDAAARRSTRTWKNV
jgi:hypothetical protein